MQTYLLAFIVSDFKHVEDPINNQRVFGTKYYIENGFADFALEAGIKIIKEMEKYLGVKYSLPKMDQIGIPDFKSGAMENWGLVTYRESRLYVKRTGSVSDKVGVANIVAHEFGHQFFGNHVSPKWWTYLWLNEGFATFFGYLGSDLAYPEFKIRETLTEGMHEAFLFDGRPMTYYVQTPQGIQDVFDQISYLKGK